MAQQNSIIFLSAVVSCIAWFYGSISYGSCKRHPDNLGVLTFCDDSESYEFLGDGFHRKYGQEKFRQRLQNQIQDWVSQATGSKLLETCPEAVNIWLSIPDANPRAATTRITVSSQPNFLFSNGLDPDKWIFSDDNLSILGEKRYPDSLGYKPALFLVKLKPNSDLSQTREFLKGYLAKGWPLGSLGYRWYSYEAPMMYEAEVIRSVQGDPDYERHFEAIHLDGIFEWIARREMVLSFPWQCE